VAGWVRDLREPSVAPLLTGLQHLLDSFAEIGLGYLSLDRPSGTLSGGEAQRTKMIRHLGSSLTDVTYVFDEPTIGLHPHDIQRMNDLLLQLRDKGNTVLVVEHKPEVIAIADHVVDLGPGAGTAGGTLCYEGKRFAPAVLKYKLGGRDISEVLAMPVNEAEAFFGAGKAATPAAHVILERLVDVGLGYISLGQPLTTLSGGERQRLKLATHMGEPGGVYVLDEPTSGLHLADVEQLL